MNLLALPKVELHLHLEGCISPAEARMLAERNPAGRGIGPSDLAACYRHGSLRDFLIHFGRLVDLLADPSDLGWLFKKVQGRLRRQGVVYAELRVSPSVWERHGLPAEETLDALLDAARTGVPRCSFIIDGVRQWDRRSLIRDFELALGCRRRGVVAFGLGGDEAAAPSSLFKELAHEARKHRFPIIPHAGEGLGADEVASALDVFDPPRIGHGIRAAESPALVAELARRGTHLEVCPTSNRRTGVVPRGKRHPLAQLWAGGVSLSLGTDDPALFHTTLSRELQWARRRLGWGPRELARSQELAARASLLPPAERESLERFVSAGWNVRALSGEGGGPTIGSRGDGACWTRV